MKLFKTLLAAVALFGAGTGAALAQSTDTATFNVTITIAESCDIHTDAPTDIDFGLVTRSGTPTSIEPTGVLTVNCSLGTPYQIGLDGGSHYDDASAGGDTDVPAAGGRRMNLDTNYVPYDLFQQIGGASFWGNTVGSDTPTGTPGTGSDQTYTVYARLRGTDATNVPAGTYADTVTATVTF